MTVPAHTPYDGSSRPFTIGLKPLDLDTWIEIDKHLPDYLREKARLNASLPDHVFAEEPDTRDAQKEVLDVLLEHLLQRFPGCYKRDGNRVHIVPAGLTVVLDAAPPLQVAGDLIQEDLVLMRPAQTGWRLAAASLCFPSSWSLRDKFGRTLTEIHDPVPDFGAGSRPDELINRMFDRLQPGNAVQRWNWSLQPDAGLYKPRAERSSANPDGPRFPLQDMLSGTFVRVERQTLRKLPISGDILFTIRIYVDPLAVLERHPDRYALAASFAEQLAALDPEQLDYKGLLVDRDRLVTMLAALAGQGGLL